MANSWSKDEVEAAVEDYFAMLRTELAGEQYNKSVHRRMLMPKLNNRSDGSVELKHQNISAVLIEMGLPYINGYKPRGNYQRLLLPDAITHYLSDHPDFYTLCQQDVDTIPDIPTVENILDSWDEPPVPDEKERKQIQEVSIPRPSNNINYLEREARNQSLGDAGETFVINFEKARLIRAGKESLVDKIEQVSVTEGPSAGYDIRSFEENGKDRFIEAKTTKYGKSTPFYVTPNELRFSREKHASYHLYRVFQFRKTPKLFALSGAIEQHCIFSATEFVARVR